jgi:hypothetical protein
MPAPPRPLPFLVDAWAEAVLHVLAHVRATAHLAASLHDAGYVEAAAKALGPAVERPLAEDARLLGVLLPTFAGLARAQGLAWLFRSTERAAACAGRDLAELSSGDVDAPDLLPHLAGDPATEILRAAAELELPLLSRLPPIAVDLAALAFALDEVAPAAPLLAGCSVGVARALGVRGRVRGRDVWVGPAPIQHTAWQAAHEATVAEVVEASPWDDGAGDHDRVERAAVALLAGRARDAGLGAAHRAWLAHFGAEVAALAQGGAERSGT